MTTSRNSSRLISRSIVMTIARKELIDSLRDRRTLVTMLLLPMVIYSGAILVSAEVAMSEREAISNHTFRVSSTEPLPPKLEASLHNTEGFQFLGQTQRLTAPLVKDSDFRGYLKSQELDYLIIPSSTASHALDTLGTAHLSIVFDATEPYAEAGKDKLRSAILEVSKEIKLERLAGLGIDEATIKPLQPEFRSVSSNADLGGQFAGSILPFLLLFFIALSSFYPAVDLTAGEKERGTIVTLLTTPVNSIEVVAGKYIAIVAIGTLTGLLNVGAMGLTFWRVLGSGGSKLSVPLPEVTAGSSLAMLIAVLLTAMLLGGIMLVASTLARSFRDANNLLSPVLFVALSPGIFGMLPRSALTAKWAAVPIANCVLLMKGILQNDFKMNLAFVVVFSTFAYTALLIFVAARLFSDESALFSQTGPRADFRSVLLSPPQPGVAPAITLIAIVFLGNYYGGLLVESWSVIGGIVANQVLFQLIPALVFARWMGGSSTFTNALGMTRPHNPHAAAMSGLLIGAGAWLGISLPILWVQQALFTGIGQASESLKDSLSIEHTPLLALLFATALVPAIIEEITFRGVILGQLRARQGAITTIVIQAVLFGLVHGSLYRFFPTAALGVLLGVIAWKTRSIWPGIVVHFLTNAILVTLESQASETFMKTFSAPTAWSFLGLVLVGLGITAAMRPKSPQQSSLRTSEFSDN
ncbi:MAG: ABC transporter permease subunit/CPBP intramembrane protease [Myxococcota bacterium]|nr:ABC transporter permease subunit/CPBP intramembrane protease [Myxococcota bacterium]